MKREDLKKLLECHGFEVAENDERCAKITDGREQVGIICDDRAILYLDADYKNAIDLWYNERDVEKKLKESISLVKKRYERFQDEKRNERLSTVRNYFNDRKYNEAIGQLFTHFSEEKL